MPAHAPKLPFQGRGPNVSEGGGGPCFTETHSDDEVPPTAADAMSDSRCRSAPKGRCWQANPWQQGKDGLNRKCRVGLRPGISGQETDKMIELLERQKRLTVNQWKLICTA